MKTFYTSRSAIETYQRCPRKRYLEYLYMGKGIRPMSTSIPLTTGSAIHAGVGYLLSCLQQQVEITAEKVLEAANIATDKYEEIVKHHFQGVETNYGQEYTYLEQKNLTAGLVILWALIEAPEIVKDYDVVSVEQEESYTLVKGTNYQIVMEARADAVLKAKAAKKDYLIYSLKSAKKWYKRQRENFKHDLQGCTETIATKYRWEQEDKQKQQILELASNAGFQDKHVNAIKNLVTNSGGRNLIGVRYCVLIKGDYKEPWEGAGFKVTHSPIVRGYKKIDVNEKKYAHSYYFENPNNKSGRGGLGSTWKPFNVWEEFDVAEWISDIWNKKIQPEAHNELFNLVSTMEVYRNTADLNKTELEITATEERVYEEIVSYPQEDLTLSLNQYVLTGYFPRYRHSCHYPTDCDYLKVCHEGELINIGENWDFREPHHELERDSRED